MKTVCVYRALIWLQNEEAEYVQKLFAETKNCVEEFPTIELKLKN